MEDIRLLLQSLPRNLNNDKQQEAASDEKKPQPLGSLQEGIEEDDDENDDDGLTIAWQYRSSVQRERQGHSNATSSRIRSVIFCHSYDLQAHLCDQMDVMQMVHLTQIPSCQACSTLGTFRSPQHDGFAYYCQLLRQLKLLLSGVPRKVVRLLFYRPNPATLQIALPLLLAHIRTNLLPVVVLIVTQPWAAPHSHVSCLQLLRRNCDVVLTTEGFASRREYPPPPEFCIFHGLLHVHKVSTVTAATALGGGHFADATVTKRPAANLYGLKRDRRKLHIELLHIPPEDFAQGGGSASGVRSGAGRPSHDASTSGGFGCASNGGGGGRDSSVLDF
jgi:hypothetical protein